jgi:hypothetical protein
MTEPTTTPPSDNQAGKAAGESSSWSASQADEFGSDPNRGANGREWLGQLQAMIDNLATNAAPVVREIGAKAAELAALAGEKAGPIAHRAADATAHAGVKVAERGREVAAELRRDAARTDESSTNGGSSGSTAAGGGETPPRATTAPTAPIASTPSSVDSLGE